MSVCHPEAYSPKDLAPSNGCQILRRVRLRMTASSGAAFAMSIWHLEKKHATDIVNLVQHAPRRRLHQPRRRRIQIPGPAQSSAAPGARCPYSRRGAFHHARSIRSGSPRASRTYRGRRSPRRRETVRRSFRNPAHRHRPESQWVVPPANQHHRYNPRATHRRFSEFICRADRRHRPARRVWRLCLPSNATSSTTIRKLRRRWLTFTSNSTPSTPSAVRSIAAPSKSRWNSSAKPLARCRRFSALVLQAAHELF